MPKADPIVGTALGGVQILEKLGSGGMGAVYLGLQTVLNRKVAVKILPEHLSKNTEYITRFCREATTAGKLEHPNIVSIYDIGHADGRYFIVMQYVEGESLQSIIDVMGTLPYRDAAKVVVGILDGLQHAHDAGIIHRDIKPDNVLITPSNQPKILDFGLAISTDSQLKLTETNTVVGTPYFISSEQARGKPAEPRSDIYSTGVTLYYLLTGRLPFTGQNALAILNMHIHEMPIALTNLNPRIPQPLNDIVLKMLAKNPSERYRTAAEAAKDIESFLVGKPIEVVVPVAPKRAAPLFTAIAAGAAALFLGVLVLLAVNQKKAAGPDPSAKPSASTVATPDDWKRVETDQAVREILTEATDLARENHAIYGRCLEKLDKLAVGRAYRKDLLAMIDEGKRSVHEAAEVVAKNIASDLRRSIDAARSSQDAFEVQQLYHKFPKYFYDITETGRAWRKEADANDQAMITYMGQQADVAIPRLIETEEYDDAALQIEYLLQKGPMEYASKLRGLRETLERGALERVERTLPQLTQDIAELQISAWDHLATLRQCDAAWDAVVGHPYRYPPKKVARSLLKMCHVADPTLKDFAPSKAGETEIASLLLRIEKDYPPADEDLMPAYLVRIVNAGADSVALRNKIRQPATRLRTLCEDVLRWEWLRRRAEAGVRRLSGSRVAFEVLGYGKIAAGKNPGDSHTMTMENGKTAPFRIQELTAHDIGYLAAAAENGIETPMERVSRTPEQNRLCMAIAVGFYYSIAADRFTQSLRWMKLAAGNAWPVPAYRFDDLDNLTEVERERIAQDFLKPARDHAAAKRFDKAQQALDVIEKEHQDRPILLTLLPIIQEHRARYLLEEANVAFQNKQWARVKQLVLKLWNEHEGFEQEASQRIYNLALLNTGTWSPSFSGSMSKWTWDGKSNTKSPATSDGTALTFTAAGSFRAMYLEPKATGGVTGFKAKVKLNQLGAFDFGLLFDGKQMMGDTRRFVLRSTGQLELSSRKEDKWGEPDNSRDNPIKLKRGEYYEIALVSDEQQTVLFFGTLGNLQPVFSTTPMDSKGILGIMTTSDSTFMDVQLRDVKP